MKKWYTSWYVRSIFSIGIISLLVFGGYLVGIHKLPPYWFIRRVELNLFGRTFEKIAEAEIPEHYDSIFLRLYSNQTDISDRLTRDGAGGGLTSFGDAALLLTHDGQVFAVRSAEDIMDTEIAAPENGFSAYEQVAQTDEFKDRKHNFGLFRYNDILFYESSQNRGLAISYTEFDSTGNCYRNAIGILPLSLNIQSVEEIKAKPTDWDVIYRTQPCLQLKSINNALEGGLAGGRIAFQAPSTIYLGSGDYHWDGMYAPYAVAQRPDFEYGKIIEINLENRQSRIFSTGIRNPQGIVFDKDGELWTAEHGLRGGDELNHILKGINYGWPIETLGTQYSKLPVPNTSSYGRHETYKEPVFAWLPSVAISNLTLVDGFHESWDGDLLMGSLRSMSLFHIRIKDDRVLFSEQIEIGERIRYVHQHTDGRIILWTDSGKLIFLTGESYSDNFVNDYLVDKINNENFRNKIRSAINSCRECHSIDPGDNVTAPSLASIFNAPIGSTDYDNYSASLKGKTGVWTEDNLKKFLLDPDTFAPGTTMPAQGLQDDAILEELITLLETLNDKSPE